MSNSINFEPSSAALLESRLPPTTVWSPASQDGVRNRIFVTLTFATSLDSSLSLAPGTRTRLSGPGSKAMTHYLRSRHSAILIGVSTMLADDPALNCRIEGVKSQPRPIIIDPDLRWTPRRSDKVLETSRDGKGLAPYVITSMGSSQIPQESVQILREHGGKFITLMPTAPSSNGASSRKCFDWKDVFQTLRNEGLPSLMVEGGGNVLNTLLEPKHHDLIDSVIVTIAPTWLGQDGVVVSPKRQTDAASGLPVPVARLLDVSWHPFGEDVVLCGRLHD